jgi:hypothetical protein
MKRTIAALTLASLVLPIAAHAQSAGEPTIICPTGVTCAYEGGGTDVVEPVTAAPVVEPVRLGAVPPPQHEYKLTAKSRRSLWLGLGLGGAALVVAGTALGLGIWGATRGHHEVLSPTVTPTPSALTTLGNGSLRLTGFGIAPVGNHGAVAALTFVFGR